MSSGDRGYPLKVQVGLISLASLLLIVAAASALLGRQSPEASYTPIGLVTAVLVALAVIFAGMLIYLSVKG